MRFVIANAVMNGSDAVLNKLDDLLTRVEDKLHELEITDADLLEMSAWYKSVRPASTRPLLLRRAAQATLYPRTSGPHLRRVQVDDEASAKVARNLAFTPLTVIVENFSSDGALLKFAIKLLATPDVHWLCFGPGAKATPPAFQIESAGGHGEIPKLVEKRVLEAKDRGIPPRVAVVIESDGEWTGDEKPHIQKRRDICAEKNIPCLILGKRTAENYIPDGVWRAWAADHAKAAPAIDALLRLSSDQRDHVHIGGADQPPWAAATPQVTALFSSVSPEDEAHLKTASLKGRPPAAIAYILEKYSLASDRADLLARDHRGDLQAIVQHIKDEL